MESCVHGRSVPEAIRASAALALAVAVAVSTAGCCFGSEWVAPQYDISAVEEASRHFVADHEAELRAAWAAREADVPGGDAGIDESGSCIDAVATLSTSLERSGWTHGHADGRPATQAFFRVGSCPEAIVVFVVLVAGAWTAVGARAYADHTYATRLATLGSPPDFEAGQGGISGAWGGAD